ncbi:hypothetical protein D0T49_00390 [Paludibacter sp. 221]|uniref:hypothetical protein n=1 Tax=Paludibacter sp. 221 TaxID=2302939 RepID=UPI0013D35FF8|nr:hypothetical protein [Paludibacter sp. 221]NDV45511.1 hypothetical protein [Paludibacter sp. 221]
MKKSKYFKITELVCKHVFDRFGEKAWMFVSDDFITMLDFIKELFSDKNVIINNWNVGGQFSQRGIRCNLCSLVSSKKVAYLSAHVTANGFDFSIPGLTADEVRKTIEVNENKLPFPIRLEDGESAPTWCHIDWHKTDDNKKITYFKG